MSDALERRVEQLISENASLKAENSRLNTESKQRRLKLKEVKEKESALSSEVEALRTAAKSAAKPSELQKQVDDLKAQIRERDHKDAFKAVAKSAGVLPDAIEAAWRLSGYQPEADEPSEELFKPVLDQLKASNGFLFGGDPSEPAAGAAKKAPLKVPVDTGRGRQDSASRPFSVSRADVNKPGWLKTWGKEYSAALQEGRLVWTD